MNQEITPHDYAMSLAERGHTAQSILLATGINVRGLTAPRPGPQAHRETEANPTPASIVRSKVREEMASICNRHGVSVEQVLAVGRKKRTVWARQEIMYVLHRTMAMPLTRVGQIMSGRHHTTILSGVRAHEARAEKMGWWI